MGFGAVLKDLRKRKGYTQDQVAEYISSHGGKHCIFKTVSHWESGVSSPSVEQFLLMCELYDVGDIQDTFRQAAPGSWGAVKLNKLGRSRVDEYIDMLGRNPLFAEEGGVRTGINHEPETETMVGQGSETRVETRPETRPETVRLFDLPAAAGTGIFMDSDSYEDFEADYAVPKDADFAVRISGDSMAPRFVDGQIVFVRSQQTIEQGEYGIFGLNGSSYIKKMGDGELISLNRRYHPIPIGEFDSFKVFGKVVG